MINILLKWLCMVLSVRTLVIPFGVMAAIVFSTASSASAANTWYVSKLATGTVHDGTSWPTGWWDFNQIDWTQVQPGDRIEIDAGPLPQPGFVSHVIYNTSLNVQKSNITVEVSNQPGHNGGIASIQSQGGGYGINIGNNSNVTVQGSKWVPAGIPQMVPNLDVQGFGTGILVGSAASRISLQNIDVEWCGTGLNLQGSTSTCNYLLIHDNYTANVNYSPNGASWVYLNHSWIFSQNQLSAGPGIVTNGQGITGKTNLILYYSILGPGLTTAIQHNASNSEVDAIEVLSIMPSVTAVQTRNTSSIVYLNGCTSFQTSLNRFNQAAACLSFTEPGQYIWHSIIYGGVVNVVGNNLLGNDICQFATTGNTQVLFPFMYDPQFLSDVSQIGPNASFSQLCGLNFATQPGSPAWLAGVKSPSSVSQYLSGVPH
jgi:hypothetical protein